MAHIPVNHPLRPLYRVLTALVGAYTLVFGIVGFTQTKGTPLFSQDHLPWVLGLRTNLAFSLLSIVGGAIILVSAVLGRNVDHFIDIVAGAVFIGVGMVMLLLLQTNANFLGFSMANCVVSFILGMIVFAAGLYGKTGTAEDRAAEESFRSR
jgi:hypothetical protein